MGVGVVILSRLRAFASLGWMRFFTTGARSLSNVWKLCTAGCAGNVREASLSQAEPVHITPRNSARALDRLP